MPTLQEITDQADTLKTTGDLHFAKKEYLDATKSYTAAVNVLAALRGSAIGEKAVISCLANQAQCFLKLEKYVETISTCNYALSVPSICHEIHLWTKLLIRKSCALEAMKETENALLCLDIAISLGTAVSTEIDETRSRLISLAASQSSSIVAIPPRPVALTSDAINEIIVMILQSQGDPDEVIPKLQEIAATRANFDVRDARQNNILWAVCQAAMIRAGEDEKDADDVLPILEILFENGSRGDQRYPGQGNRSPLLMLAMAGATECIRLALWHGAGVSTYDDQGFTALSVACAPNGPCSGNNSDVVELLIAAKSRVGHRTGEGLTPLALAAQSNDAESVRLLIAAGAPVGVRCLLGFSPVVWGLVGSRGQLNESVRFILGAAAQSDDLLRRQSFEFAQDIKCFCFSQLLEVLRQEHVKLGGAAAALAPTMALQTRRVVVAKLMAMLDVPETVSSALASLPLPPPSVGGGIASDSAPTGPTGPTGPLSSPPSLLERLFVAIDGATPAVMGKRWWLYDGSQQGQGAAPTPPIAAGAALMPAALANASILERCWLQIVMTAAFGPRPPGAAPFLIMPPFSSSISDKGAASDPFLIVSLFLEYSIFLRDAVVGVFSAAVPLRSVIAIMAEHRNLAIVTLGADSTAVADLSDSSKPPGVAETGGGGGGGKEEGASKVSGAGKEGGDPSAASGVSGLTQPGLKNPRAELYWRQELLAAGAFVGIHQLSLPPVEIPASQAPVIIVPDMFAACAEPAQIQALGEKLAALVSTFAGEVIYVVGETSLEPEPASLPVAVAVDAEAKKAGGEVAGPAEGEGDSTGDAGGKAGGEAAGEVPPGEATGQDGASLVKSLAHSPSQLPVPPHVGAAEPLRGPYSQQATPFSMDYGAAYAPMQAALAAEYTPRFRTMLPNWLWERNEFVAWYKNKAPA